MQGEGDVLFPPHRMNGYDHFVDNHSAKTQGLFSGNTRDGSERGFRLSARICRDHDYLDMVSTFTKGCPYMSMESCSSVRTDGMDRTLAVSFGCTGVRDLRWLVG